MKKYRFYWLAALTLFGFPLVGWLIAWLVGDNFWNQFSSDYSLPFQVLIGVLYGLWCGALCWMFITSRVMGDSRSRYLELLEALELSPFKIILISIAAGVGEEVLFRGVIQEYLGIPITSVLFIAIHGYYSFKDWRLLLYGLLMTLLIMGMGVIMEQMGVTAPIIAHTIIDLILLFMMYKTVSKQNVIHVYSDEEE